MPEDRRLSVALSRVLIACVKAVSALGAIQRWLAVLAVILSVLVVIGSFRFRRIDINITIYENVHIEDSEAWRQYGEVSAWKHDFGTSIPLPGSVVNSHDSPLIRSGVIPSVPSYPQWW